MAKKSKKDCLFAFETMRVADISVRYITKQDRDRLFDKDCEVPFRRGIFGYFNSSVLMSVETTRFMEKDKEEILTAFLNEGFSYSIAALFMEAREQRIGYILFDVDGCDVEGAEVISDE